MNLNKPEPMPFREDGAREVWPLVWADIRSIATPYPVRSEVLEDMAERDAEGWKQYGGPLVDCDTRSGLVDMYQELMDGAVYGKKAQMQGGLDDEQMLILAEVYYNLIQSALAVRWIIEHKK